MSRLVYRLVSRPVMAAILASVLCSGSVAQAAVPVEESIAVGRERVDSARNPQSGFQSERNTSQPASPSSANAQLFLQIQSMQAEILELRGLVEEQGYLIARMRRDQKEQYIDLDGRIASLTGRRTQPPSPEEIMANTSNPPAQNGSAQNGNGGVSAPVIPSPAVAAPGSEREAYSAAFNLMKNRQYDESIEAFSAIAATYPSGEYTANVHYWLGELYLAKTDYEQARQEFVQVTNLYPNHAKVSDALYKLGVVYYRLGDTGKSRDYLDRVQREYPQSSAAGLAENYSAEIQ